MSLKTEHLLGQFSQALYREVHCAQFQIQSVRFQQDDVINHGRWDRVGGIGQTNKNAVASLATSPFI